MDERTRKRYSKYLSLLLRHHPERGDLVLDREGWTDTRALLKAVEKGGLPASMEALEEVLRVGEETPFEFNPEKNMIRATHGHSVDAVLTQDPDEPPEILYHGTIPEFMKRIREEGLLPKGRQYVHLSDTIRGAEAVGRRRGTPRVLIIRAQEMSEDGHTFFRSKDGVWLTRTVPPEFLEWPSLTGKDE